MAVFAVVVKSNTPQNVTMSSIQTCIVRPRDRAKSARHESADGLAGKEFKLVLETEGRSMGHLYIYILNIYNEEQREKWKDWTELEGSI